MKIFFEFLKIFKFFCDFVGNMSIFLDLYRKYDFFWIFENILIFLDFCKLIGLIGLNNEPIWQLAHLSKD